jgi:hypothetical protein
MSHARMMIYPAEFSVSHEKRAPEEDPGCVRKIEWKKM